MERSLQLSGDIGDQDSAAKFEGSADFALTGMKLPFNESSGDGIDERSLFSGDSAEEVISERSLSGFAGSGDHQFTGMALFVAESSGEGVDERALVYISEEINSFSGDNEEDIADPRSLVTFEKPDELAQFYDYENITDSFSGDDGDDVEERSMFTDLEIHDVLNAALQKNVDMLEGVIEGKNCRNLKLLIINFYFKKQLIPKIHLQRSFSSVVRLSSFLFSKKRFRNCSF